MNSHKISTFTSTVAFDGLFICRQPYRTVESRTARLTAALRSENSEFGITLVVFIKQFYKLCQNKRSLVIKGEILLNAFICLFHTYSPSR